MHYICPVCGNALEKREKQYICANSHSFDIARQGYVNLLRTNRSKDKRHGDDKRMVAARTAFLDAGYYAPLRDAIAAAATEYTSGDAGVLDAGCGEGYYTAHVLHTLQAQGASPSVSPGRVSWLVLSSQDSSSRVSPWRFFARRASMARLRMHWQSQAQG